MLNFVPNIGSMIAAIPAVLMAMIQFNIATAGWIALIYLLVNNIVGNVVEPRLMGRSLGLSTLVVFLSLVFWGWLLGPVGMFLSVPLTMTLKIAFDSNDETRWLAVLLGGDGGERFSVGSSSDLVVTLPATMDEGVSGDDSSKQDGEQS